jgi:hypothetical protein
VSVCGAGEHDVPLDCSDLIVSHARIGNKKTGLSDGQRFTVESPDLVVGFEHEHF